MHEAISATIAIILVIFMFLAVATYIYNVKSSSPPYVFVAHTIPIRLYAFDNGTVVATNMYGDKVDAFTRLFVIREDCTIETYDTTTPTQIFCVNCWIIPTSPSAKVLAVKRGTCNLGSAGIYNISFYGINTNRGIVQRLPSLELLNVKEYVEVFENGQRKRANLSLTDTIKKTGDIVFREENGAIIAIVFYQP